MAEPSSIPAPETPTAPAPAGGRSKDEVALDLMKFIVVNTGYGKGAQGGAGFSSKPSGRSAEEQAESLIELFQRCRKAVGQE
jgi:hypothetical protein